MSPSQFSRCCAGFCNNPGNCAAASAGDPCYNNDDYFGDSLCVEFVCTQEASARVKLGISLLLARTNRRK